MDCLSDPGCWVRMVFLLGRNYKYVTQIYDLIILEVESLKWIPLDQSRGIGSTVFFSGGRGGRFVFLAFQLLEDTHNPWLTAPFCLQSLQRLLRSLPHYITLMPTPLSSLSYCDLTWTTQDHQSMSTLDSLCCLNSPLPCDIIYLPILGIGTWTAFGIHYSGYHRGKHSAKNCHSL